MKRVVLSLLLALSLLTVSGFSLAEEVQGPLTSAGAEEAVFIPGSVPAESEAMTGMIAPVNAVVMCMVENDMAYDRTDGLFLWRSVYYMLSLYGEMDQRAELTGDTLIAPSEMVQDYAGAMFGSMPALPQGVDKRLSYDEKSDSYLLARGDAGQSETVFTSVTVRADGLVELSGAMRALDDGSEIAAFSALLTPKDNMFGYEICQLDILL